MKRMFLLAAAAMMTLTAGSAFAASSSTTDRPGHVQVLSGQAFQSVDPVFQGSYGAAPARTGSQAQLNAQYHDSMRLSEALGGSFGGGS